MRVHTVTAVLSRMVRCVADSATTAKAIDHHGNVIGQFLDLVQVQAEADGFIQALHLPNMV